MSFKRVDTIFARVQRNVKSAGAGPEGVQSLDADTILDAMSETHEEIARDGYAIRDMTDLTTEAGTARYDILGLYKIAGLRMPADWKEPITIEENLESWLEYIANPLTYTQPVKALSWGNYLEFFPSPAVSGLKVGVYFYRIPTALLVLGADPESPREWDYVITEGATAKLLGGGDYAAMYRAAFDDAKQKGLKETAGGLITVQHWSDRGF